jgi:hypothetical protein
MVFSLMLWKEGFETHATFLELTPLDHRPASSSTFARKPWAFARAKASSDATADQ